MKKFYSALLISLIFPFLESNAQNHLPLIREYNHVSGKYALKVYYEYDNQNRVIKSISNNYEINEQGEWKNTNVAQPNTVSHTYYRDSIVSNANGIWVKIILNQNNLFEKDVAVNEFSKTGALTNRITRTYNADGFVIKQIIFDDYVDYSNTSTTDYEYLNGNLAKEITKHRRMNSEGGLWENSGILQYEYLENTANSLGNANLGTAYLGKSSRNLVEKLKNENGYVAYYQYNFDKDGNVAKKTLIRIADGVKMSEESYKY